MGDKELREKKEKKKSKEKFRSLLALAEEMKYLIVAIVETPEPYRSGDNFVDWMKRKSKEIEGILKAKKVMIWVF